MIKILYILPSILLLVQAFDSIFVGYLSLVRGIMLIFLICSFYIRLRLKIDLIGKLILLFLGYTFILSFFSSNYQVTLLGYASIFVSMSFYIISYNSITDYAKFMNFKVLLFQIPSIFIITAIVNSIFNLGGPAYHDEYQRIHMGSGIHHNTIYIGNLVVILYLNLMKYSSNKTRDTFLICVMIILILLSFRRTAIILLIVSYSIFIFFSNKKFFVKYVLPGILLTASLYPFYGGHFENIAKARGSRATFEKGIKTESRYLEAKVITKKIASFKDLNYSMFGIEFLNSFNTYYSLEFSVSPSRVCAL